MLFSPSHSLAASTLSFYPSSGSKTGAFNVALKLNTGGADVYGADFRVNYSGPITYVSGSIGNIEGCDPTYYPNSGYVRVYCLINLSSYNGTDGTIGVLTFQPTDSGTATLTYSNIDVGGDVTSTSASFTVAVGEGGLPLGPSQLPDTGIFNGYQFIGIITGVAVLVLGFLFMKSSQGSVVFVPIQKIRGLKKHSRHVIVCTDHDSSPV